MTRHYPSQSAFHAEATTVYSASGIAALSPSVPASGDVAATGIDHDKRFSPSSRPFLVYAIGLLMVSIVALWPFAQSPHGSNGGAAPLVQTDGSLLAASEAQTRIRSSGMEDFLRIPENSGNDRSRTTPSHRQAAVVQPEIKAANDPDPIAGQPALVNVFIAHD